MLTREALRQSLLWLRHSCRYSMIECVCVCVCVCGDGDDDDDDDDDDEGRTALKSAVVVI